MSRRASSAGPYKQWVEPEAELRTPVHTLWPLISEQFSKVLTLIGLSVFKQSLHYTVSLKFVFGQSHLADKRITSGCAFELNNCRFFEGALWQKAFFNFIFLYIKGLVLFQKSPPHLPIKHDITKADYLAKGLLWMGLVTCCRLLRAIAAIKNL
jgi:hypothetical protein